MKSSVMIVPPGGGHKLWFLGQMAIHLARGDQTDDMYTVGCGETPAGQGPPPHVHSREDEAFYVLSGEFEFRAGNGTVTCGPDSFVTIRPGTAHTFRCIGSNPGHLIVFCAPAGFDRFQSEAGDPYVNGQPMPQFDLAAAIARLMSVAPKYGIDLNPPAEAFTVAPQMRVSGPTDGPAFAVGGDRYRILATGDDTGGRFAALEIAVWPGGGSPLHRHAFVSEGFYVLDGDVEFMFGTNRIQLSAGAFYHVPAGRVQRYRNVGQTVARLLAFAVPAGIERFIADVGTPMAQADAVPPAPTAGELERLVARAPLCGLEISPAP